MKRILLASFAILSLLSTSAVARPVAVLSYEELMEQSDLVVIASADSVEEFDGPIEIPLFQDVLVAQVGTFRIEGVLKGEHEPGTLELIHCRLANEWFFPPNGPLLARFETEGRLIRIDNEEGEEIQIQEAKPSYLLFLKRRDDGRYIPLTGVVDSELSVRRVTAAFSF